MARRSRASLEEELRLLKELAALRSAAALRAATTTPGREPAGAFRLTGEEPPRPVRSWAESSPSHALAQLVIQSLEIPSSMRAPFRAIPPDEQVFGRLLAILRGEMRYVLHAHGNHRRSDVAAFERRAQAAYPGVQFVWIAPRGANGGDGVKGMDELLNLDAPYDRRTGLPTARVPRGFRVTGPSSRRGRRFGYEPSDD